MSMLCLIFHSIGISQHNTPTTMGMTTRVISNIGYLPFEPVALFCVSSLQANLVNHAHAMGCFPHRRFRQVNCRNSERYLTNGFAGFARVLLELVMQFLLLGFGELQIFIREPFPHLAR
jgi:hypothetical protein